jgi:hypothetical protein
MTNRLGLLRPMNILEAIDKQREWIPELFWL